jgi:hypothetical protein
MYFVRGENGEQGIYEDCSKLEGFTDGACGNCKRGDRGKQCSKSSTVQDAERRANESAGANYESRVIRQKHVARHGLRSEPEFAAAQGIDIESEAEAYEFRRPIELLGEGRKLDARFVPDKDK